jgi:hypothetical protein
MHGQKWLSVKEKAKETGGAHLIRETAEKFFLKKFSFGCDLFSNDRLNGVKRTTRG